MATGLQHCGLVVSELERSRRFYSDVLGFEEVARPRTFTFLGAWFRVGESEIHLLAASDTTGRAGIVEPGPSVAVGLASHIAFEVDDLDASVARVHAHGVPVVGGPMARGDGVTQVFLRDPDGYVLELFERTGEDQSDAPERAAFRG